jgi:hypothetical protein
MIAAKHRGQPFGVACRVDRHERPIKDSLTRRWRQPAPKTRSCTCPSGSATRRSWRPTADRFDRSWHELQSTVDAVPKHRLVDIRDPAGWSAKDHLMHVAVWEQAFLAKLDGRPRHQALGIDAATDGSGDDDTINAAIFAATRHRALPDVLEALRTTHAS